MIIAIDGPAGAGKSTVARAVASRIGAGYLDTGAMYRALTVVALRQGLDVRDGAALAALASDTRIDLERIGDGGLVVRVDGEDVTDAIRAAEVTDGVSAVAAHGAVRERMVARQREILSAGGWVADGRDLGTTVVPGAEVKVFLTATLDARAARRAVDLGPGAALAEVREAVKMRDQLDSTRAQSPLRQADDAHVIDSTDMTAEEVVDAVVALAESARTAPGAAT
jgi:cytidylate kinase